MKIEFDSKSVFVGAVIGWFLTIFAASRAVALDKIQKEREEEAE